MKTTDNEKFENYCSLCTASADAISYGIEVDGLKKWVDALEKSWLQQKQGELIKSGMNVFAARIHADTQLSMAKNKYLGS